MKIHADNHTEKLLIRNIEIKTLCFAYFIRVIQVSPTGYPSFTDIRYKDLITRGDLNWPDQAVSGSASDGLWWLTLLTKAPAIPNAQMFDITSSCNERCSLVTDKDRADLIREFWNVLEILSGKQKTVYCYGHTWFRVRSSRCLPEYA